MKSRPRAPRPLLAALALAAALLGAAGCDEDETGAPATLADIWPHADGSSWTYDLTQNYRQTEIAGPDSTLPSMEDLCRDLMQPVPGLPDTVIARRYSLTFDGITTTGSGVRAQNLVETFEDPATSRPLTLAAADLPPRLFRIIAAVRPELGLAAAADTFVRVSPAPPVFLAGGAFAYEDTGYYGYGDLDTFHSWIYLEGSLDPGQEFRLQLIPELADDVWLRGRILRSDRGILGGEPTERIECLYVVDLGADTVADTEGNVIGKVRSYYYGRISYVSGVGPVSTRERGRLVIRSAYYPLGNGQYFIVDARADLTDHHLADG